MLPSRAESWTALEADLCSPGWSQRLQAAGFDPSLPTVWVAEGLLMYLTQHEVDALLREMAGGQAPCCLLWCVSYLMHMLGVLAAHMVVSCLLSLHLSHKISSLVC